jgi:hypothetical protein
MNLLLLGSSQRAADLYDLLKRAFERQVSRDIAKALALTSEEVCIADDE